MKLDLIWEDRNKEKYNIAKLEKKEKKYLLTICEENLKKAIRKGCVGIGNINFLKNQYESNELFPFFKNRIPSKNNPNIEKILEEYNLKSYDEMELLKVTKAERQTDRYYVIQSDK